MDVQFVTPAIMYLHSALQCRLLQSQLYSDNRKIMHFGCSLAEISSV